MEYIPAPKWANSPGITAAGQVFVARWLELFHRLTIDSYRVRHLNLRLGFEELARVVSDVAEIGIDALNVREVAAEVLRLLREDPVASDVLPNRKYYYGALAHFGLLVIRSWVHDTRVTVRRNRGYVMLILRL